MTIGIRNILGVLRGQTINRGEELGFGRTFFNSLSPTSKYVYLLLFGTHYQHLLELLVSIAYYQLFYSRHMLQANHLYGKWVLEVILFNIVCEFLIYGGWHMTLYNSSLGGDRLAKYKFHPDNQYSGPDGQKNLQREVLYTSLGWLQSSLWQIAGMYLIKVGFFSEPALFWSNPVLVTLSIMLQAQWRYFHFYLAHRFMHAWGFKICGVDFGQVMYDHVHSLHHKSHSPGPFSGLSMHPVEHLIYYSCVLLPLIFGMHPLAFLYCKFHADISPCGGHDGYGNPGGDSTYHYVHHSKFNANYGVPAPLINFDWLAGTEASLDAVKECKGNLKEAIALTQERNGSGIQSLYLLLSMNNTSHTKIKK